MIGFFFEGTGMVGGGTKNQRTHNECTLHSSRRGKISNNIGC